MELHSASKHEHGYNFRPTDVDPANIAFVEEAGWEDKANGIASLVKLKSGETLKVSEQRLYIRSLKENHTGVSETVKVAINEVFPQKGD